MFVIRRLRFVVLCCGVLVSRVCFVCGLVLRRLFVDGLFLCGVSCVCGRRRLGVSEYSWRLCCGVFLCLGVSPLFCVLRRFLVVLLVVHLHPRSPVRSPEQGSERNGSARV